MIMVTASNAKTFISCGIFHFPTRKRNDIPACFHDRDFHTGESIHKEKEACHNTETTTNVTMKIFNKLKKQITESVSETY